MGEFTGTRELVYEELRQEKGMRKKTVAGAWEGLRVGFDFGVV